MPRFIAVISTLRLLFHRSTDQNSKCDPRIMGNPFMEFVNNELSFSTKKTYLMESNFFNPESELEKGKYETNLIALNRLCANIKRLGPTTQLFILQRSLYNSTHFTTFTSQHNSLYNTTHYTTQLTLQHNSLYNSTLFTLQLHSIHFTIRLIFQLKFLIKIIPFI